MPTPTLSVSLPRILRAGLRCGVLMSLVLGCVAASDAARAETDASEEPLRIVSLNPSLTSILVALGAERTLVGVDEYSARMVPEVAGLVRVGGLYNPSLEGVVSLQPDLVLVVPSVEQRDFVRRLRDLGIGVELFENISFEQVLENIRRIGALVDRSEAARRRVAKVRTTRADLQALTRRFDSPATLVVIQRDPLFVVGSGSFIDEMLQAVGASNPAMDFEDAYPRVAVEWVVSRAPAVIVDLTPDPEPASKYWARWPAIPAVRNGRVVALDAATISLPGPRLDDALERLAVGVHGEAVAQELAARRAARAKATERTP